MLRSAIAFGGARRRAAGLCLSIFRVAIALLGARPTGAPGPREQAR